MRAFRYQVKIEFSEQKSEAIGILGDLLAIRPLDPQPVSHSRGRGRRKQAGRVSDAERRHNPAARRFDQIDGLCSGQIDAHHSHSATLVRAEDREGIAVAPFDQCPKRIVSDAGEKFRAFDIHAVTPAKRDTISVRPASGIGSHFGLLRAS